MRFAVGTGNLTYKAHCSLLIALRITGSVILPAFAGMHTFAGERKESYR
jgi:hypothetical protein